MLIYRYLTIVKRLVNEGDYKKLVYYRSYRDEIEDLTLSAFLYDKGSIERIKIRGEYDKVRLDINFSTITYLLASILFKYIEDRLTNARERRRYY